MEEVFICPFCGREGFKRKSDLAQHIKYCKSNPDRVEHYSKGKTHSEETKQKIGEASKRVWENPEYRQKQSETQKGKTRSEETIQKIIEANKGKTRSEETKRKMSEANKIAQNRPEVKQKISKALKGRTFSDETRQKISKVHKGKTLSEEHKQKIGESSKGRTFSDEHKQKISEAHNRPETKQKSYNTKKQNNSFNSSKIEEQLKEYFISNNINFKTQYKSKEYPFMCDFYFPDKDLYVEIQGTWTHGKRPYVEDDLDCIELLELWKSKNKPFYLNAIDTWTIRDVRKRNYAKEHNLNWIEIFSCDLNVCLKIIMKLL